MGRLSDLLEELAPKERIILGGPYGTEIKDRLAKDRADHVPKASRVPLIPDMGEGTSALLTAEGEEYVAKLTDEYLAAVRADQAFVLPIDSFGLAKQMLETPAGEGGIAGTLPRKGALLCARATRIATESLNKSGRDRGNTLVAMNMGPPWNCYKPEIWGADAANKYLPQTFAAVRFLPEVDYLMFETVPSLEGAIGAAQAFTQAHRNLDLADDKGDRVNSGTATYMADFLEYAREQGSLKTVAPSYDPENRSFSEIPTEKEYVISLNLGADGNVHPQGSLYFTLNTLYREIRSQGLTAPTGITLNCNSLEVVSNALEQLARNDESDHGGNAPDPAPRPKLMDKIIGVHLNASTENDRRLYDQIDEKQKVEDEDFAAGLLNLAEKYNLQIVGPCCGGDPNTVNAISQEVKNRAA